MNMVLIVHSDILRQNLTHTIFLVDRGDSFMQTDPGLQVQSHEFHFPGFLKWNLPIGHLLDLDTIIDDDDLVFYIPFNII